MFSVEHHRNKIDVFNSWLTIVEGLLAFSVLLVVVYLFIYFLSGHTESCQIYIHLYIIVIPQEQSVIYCRYQFNPC